MYCIKVTTNDESHLNPEIFQKWEDAQNAMEVLATNETLSGYQRKSYVEQGYASVADSTRFVYIEFEILRLASC